MAPIIDRVFRDLPLTQFIEEFLHRLPLALPDVASDLRSLGSWDTLETMLTNVHDRPPLDVLVLRDGHPCPAGMPSNAAGFQRLSAEGWTARVRHSERHHPLIADLAAQFAQAFRAPVDVHLYFTPSGQLGLSWHYDAEDVFILQTAGEKDYFLRKNTVHPWPLEETIPADMKYERELMPLTRVTLHAGDLLYVPCGYWHRADAAASEETAISLAVGVMSPAAIQILDLLRPQLLGSLAWRQRLAVGVEANIVERYRTLLAVLADDVARTLRDPGFLELVTAHFVTKRDEVSEVCS